MYFNATSTGAAIGLLAIVVSLSLGLAFYFRNKEVRLYESFVCLLLGFIPPLNLIYAAVVSSRNFGKVQDHRVNEGSKA